MGLGWPRLGSAQGYAHWVEHATKKEAGAPAPAWVSRRPLRMAANGYVNVRRRYDDAHERNRDYETGPCSQMARGRPWRCKGCQRQLKLPGQASNSHCGQGPAETGG